MSVVLTPQGVELATQEIADRMRALFNQNIATVWKKYEQATGSINLPVIQTDRYYFSEGIDPLLPPAVFIVAERSDLDLSAQNYHKSKHAILLSVLFQDMEITRLTKGAWRYGLAAWMTLHDANTGTCHVLVRGIDYSPTYTRKGPGGERQFRKDITLRLDVSQYEAITR